MRRNIVALFGVILLGCATTDRINRVSLGMTKTEVIAAMGQPDSTSARDNVEALYYVLVNNPVYPTRGGTWAVKLENGRVVSYGQINNNAPVWDRPLIIQ